MRYKLRVAYILVVEFKLRVAYLLVVEFKLRVAHILVVKLLEFEKTPERKIDFTQDMKYEPHSFITYVCQSCVSRKYEGILNLNKNDTLTTRIKRFYYILKEKEVLSTSTLNSQLEDNFFLISASLQFSLERPYMEFKAKGVSKGW